ncbi:cuticle protein 19.8-like [Homarus americanus]|uniref:Cuticle protein-like 1 n=1 Tax=Homarus americanus TaxID=6706 RepID=A0A8J5JTX9_HOMAM|nr:cuticle protein 19.8-like [Homarus americanus]KAG7159159.1 Cuticle protein-like 1 [Homarus americanus]
MTTKVVFLAALVAAALARPDTASSSPYSAAVAYPDTPPQYNTQFAVRDEFGNDFSQQESRDGYNTQGSYTVNLPDGRVQRVNYRVDGESGYVADVTYEGEALYPAAAPSYTPAPTYT